MNDLFTYSLSVFMGFFAIMNPIANIPIFLGLTGGESKESKKKIAKTATITAFLIVLAFILAGKYIFEVFGITIPAFKITGGILIFYVGFEMLVSKKSQVQNIQTDSANNIAISPLAIPILAGPGTIVTAMNYVTNASLTHIGIIIGIFALMIVLNFMAFSLSNMIINRIGNNLITVISKLMGLILAIIGTGVIIQGIKMAFSIL